MADRGPQHVAQVVDMVGDDIRLDRARSPPATVEEAADALQYLAGRLDEVDQPVPTADSGIPS